MINNFINIGSYGIFVWLSFSITIIVCYGFYYRTKKTLKKYEEEFATELNKLTDSEKQVVLAKSKIASEILVSQKKTV